ncbi:MAG: hypothetical protein AAFU65_01135 [Pseudomonadota bacterium]
MVSREDDKPLSAIDSEAVEQIRLLVGDAVFARGERALADDRVGPLSVDDHRATAVVSGRQDHHVTVRRTARGYEGACDCPASDGFDFCEHCVAVALAMAQRDAQRERARSGSPEDRLRVYLGDLAHAELVDLLIDAADQAPALKERLQLKSDVASGALDLRALKKRVTAALPLRDVWQRAKVRAYFSHAVTALTDLLAIADAVPADTLMTISEYAIERLVRVQDRIDDADGHRWFAQDRVRELYAAALTRSDLSAEARAEHLLRHVLTDPTDAFSGGASDFERALGDEGLAAFFAAVRARLDDETTRDAHRLRLRTLLNDRARATGDIQGLIDLQREDTHTAQDHYRLSELYLELPDLDAALAALDKGDELAGPARHNLAIRVRVHAAREEWGDAVTAQTAELLRAPSMDAYERLGELADHLGTRQQAMRRAETRLARQLSAGNANRNAAATVLARVAWDRGERDRAFDVAVEHIHDVDTLLPMIDGLREEQPARAAQLLDCAVEATIAQKKSGAYRDAVALIRDYRDLFDGLGPRMFDAFLTDLRERHRAKRNLMMLLEHLVAEGVSGAN